MKTLGATLIVMGILVSITGYSLYDDTACRCLTSEGSHLSGCHCQSQSQQSIGHAMAYAGLAIVAGGMTVFLRWWRKKVVFN